jgi:ATP-dependent exoDNAse (exonuclease V) beta subunit
MAWRNNPDKKQFSLDTNYRSYSQIIDFNNDFFEFLSEEFENEDYKDLYKNHSRQKTNSKKGGYVNILFIPQVEKAEMEAVEGEESLDKMDFYLLATLNAILKVKNNGFKNKDIVILTRKKAQGTAIANYLTEKGIPILSSESLLINSSSEVQFIIHFLYYLKNSNDLQSKANFLYYLAKKQEGKIAIHDFIAQGMELKTEPEFQKWLLNSKIELNFQNIRKKSLYEATEVIISKAIAVEKRNAYVQYFLDIILERDVRNQAGIADFLNYWDKNGVKLSIPSPEGNDAVRIMTIHKSKGLEFPVVIFPFAEEDFSKGPREKIWLNADEKTMGLPKVLVDKNSRVVGYGEEASTTYLQKKQEDLLDTINVLYVALTRAEEQLHIISNMNIGKKGVLPNNMSTFFIKFLEDKGFNESKMDYEFGTAKKLSAENNQELATQKIPQVVATLNPKNIKIAQRESVMWNTKQQEAIEYGNSIHEILSFVKTKKDIDLAITTAIENGLIVVNQKEVVYNAIFEIVTHKELLGFFSEENKVLNEKTIIQKEGNLVKPDRMVINKANEIYLLDYKTGLHQAKYQLQLDTYQKAIEKMGFKVVKKALIYIGETINVVNL